MFEHLCALLLRLYPAGFRRAYGDDAVELMRDRARHERGLFRRVRLLIDLAIDLAAMSLRGWQVGTSSLARPNGAPRFETIDVRGPRPVALAIGMLTSILMFATFGQVLQMKRLPTALARLSGRLSFDPDAMVSTEAVETAKKRVDQTVEAVDVVQPPPFETVTITPARSADPRDLHIRVRPNGDFSASAVSVLWLLHYAYDLPINPSPRLSGVPDWHEIYDIEARAPADAVPAALPERLKRRRVQSMIRGLLGDRFKLVMRVEQKTLPVYALTVARGGPHLQKSPIAEKDCLFDTGSPDSCHLFIVGRGHPLNARAIDTDDLAHYIENWADLPVVNRTAVSGLFAVDTDGWLPMRLPPPPPGDAPAAGFDDLPTIFTVLQKLGLELKPQEATVPVYTVKYIERPDPRQGVSAR
jgi:uncharacterized protein (TIGR03435 family)